MIARRDVFCFRMRLVSFGSSSSATATASPAACYHFHFHFHFPFAAFPKHFNLISIRVYLFCCAIVTGVRSASAATQRDPNRQTDRQTHRQTNPDRTNPMNQPTIADRHQSRNRNKFCVKNHIKLAFNGAFCTQIVLPDR